MLAILLPQLWSSWAPGSSTLPGLCNCDTRAGRQLCSHRAVSQLLTGIYQKPLSVCWWPPVLFASPSVLLGTHEVPAEAAPTPGCRDSNPASLLVQAEGPRTGPEHHITPLDSPSCPNGWYVDKGPQSPCHPLEVTQVKTLPTLNQRQRNPEKGAGDAKRRGLGSPPNSWAST